MPNIKVTDAPDMVALQAKITEVCNRAVKEDNLEAGLVAFALCRAMRDVLEGAYGEAERGQIVTSIGAYLNYAQPADKRLVTLH